MQVGLLRLAGDNIMSASCRQVPVEMDQAAVSQLEDKDRLLRLRGAVQSFLSGLSRRNHVQRSCGPLNASGRCVSSSA